MPARLPKTRVLPLLAAVALGAAVTGCAGYDDRQACADLSAMVWPWQKMDDLSVTVAPAPGPLDTPAYRTRVVRVAGTLPDGAGGQRQSAAFECVHRGELLQSFGWTEPNALTRPELRVGPSAMR